MMRIGAPSGGIVPVAFGAGAIQVGGGPYLMSRDAATACPDVKKTAAAKVQA